MGGRLLTSVFNLPEKRISRAEYFEIREQLVSDFKGAYPLCRIETPRVLGDKSSFGDIDVLCNLQHDQIKKVIQEKYHPKPHSNAGVFSFPFRDFQCDLIHTPDNYFQIGHDFYSHGDLGNLIGRNYNFFGLNFGHKGLFYRLYHSYFSGREQDKSPLDKIVISTDMREILTFIGLDYDRWARGFQNETEVFEFVESAPYFNARMFFFDELNNENRTRNLKRPMYCRFVERIAEKYKDQVIPRLSANYWFPKITARWPHILEEIEKHRPKYEKQYIISKKWNGDMVKKITGLDGPELGKLIVGLKTKYAPFDQFILNNTVDSIKLAIKEFQNNPR